MRRLLITLCLAVPLNAAAAPVYRWVDSDGVTHYSDRLPDDPGVTATREDIGPSATRARRVTAATPGEPTGTQPGSNPAEPSGYDRVTLVSPANGATITGFEGTMDVILDVQPPVFSDHVLRLYIDGARRTVTPAPTIQLTGIEPGTHTLFAEITDTNGRFIARSSTNRFSVRPAGESP